MSMDFSIISPNEIPLSAPRRFPVTPLCSLRDVLDWVTRRGNLYRHDTLDYSIGTSREGAARLGIVTTRAAALRVELPEDDERVWPETYVERDDDAVTRITFNGYGDFDYTLISQCADWLGAVVHDHQSSEVLTAADAEPMMLALGGAAAIRRRNGT